MDLLSRRSGQRSPLTKIELEREARISMNRKRMEELGVLETARNLVAAINASKPQRTFRPKQPRAPRVSRPKKIRRSVRIRGRPRMDYVAAANGLEQAPVASSGEGASGGAHGEGAAEGDGEAGCVLSEWEGSDLDDLLAGDEDVSSWEPAKQELFQEMRCVSAHRGSVYDSRAGITCHFCRQKKLCGEDDCPRCSRRSATADCLGKTDCSRCHGGSGRFCRACLLLRYGQTIEEARAQMAAGEWLCPHCYEEEHPDEGWMCNSSICMKRRGFRPTGIAIFDAQQRGYTSVAHWLQAQLKKRGTAAIAADPADGGAAAEAAPPRRSARQAAGAGEEGQAAAAAASAAADAAEGSGPDQDGGVAAAATASGRSARSVAGKKPAAKAEGTGAGAMTARGTARGTAGGAARGGASASSREGSSEPTPAAAAAAPVTGKRSADAGPGKEAAPAAAQMRPQRQRRASTAYHGACWA